MQHACQEMVALHLRDAQLDEDGGLPEAGGDGFEPVPIGFRQPATLAVLRQAHVGEGQEDDPLPQVVVAAGTFDEIL